MQDYNQAWSFIAGIAGDPNTATIDFRAIHDTDKARPAIPFRGMLSDCWSSIVHYNSQGYGIFATVAAMDGVGRELANVWYIRAHYIDLDGADAQQQYERAVAWSPSPAFGVQSSPGKYHVYWPVVPYQGNNEFTLLQRKLRQLFNADNIIDPTRVMRLPGTLHLKNPDAPHLVTMWGLAGWGQLVAVDVLTTATAHVNVIDGGTGERRPLGDPALAAPDLTWITRALAMIDPNNLDRGEWIAITAAVKQAGWSHGENAVRAIWDAWCERYADNDLGENTKQWLSVRDSELGWSSLQRRAPGVTLAGHGQSWTPPATATATPDTPALDAPPMPTLTAPPLDCSGEFLTHVEQAHWFRGCTFVVSQGEILTPNGRFLNVTKFNGQYGGKKFIIDTVGKMTNEPWAAATRSTLWQVPKVDHVRFIPHAEPNMVVADDLGREGINLYRPAVIRRACGDPTPFLNHLAALLPVAADQRIILDYLAHNAKYPGYKIPWAPVIQSTEGAGKGILKAIMRHVMGAPYVHFPNAKELTNSGSQFNAWMRHKLFILADEIKVDDRRDLIEVLKPMISEEIIEVQGKGDNQVLEDNFANWLFFTNYKDAIPVNRNGRRYSIFFSALQTYDDLLARGMNETYFTAVMNWLKGEGDYLAYGAGYGASVVADYLLSYDIKRGAIPMRAPDTSSIVSAIDISRTPIERMIAEAVEDGLPGFRGGWISATAVAARLRLTGAARTVGAQTLHTIIEGMGYAACGRSERPYFQEDKDSRSHLFHWGAPAPVALYGAAQGYP